MYIDRNSPQKKGGMLLSSSSPQTLSYEENSQLAVSLLVTVLNEENRALISLEASSRSEIYLGSNPASASLVQRGVNLFELFAKHQPGVAGCGWLQPGRNFLST